MCPPLKKLSEGLAARAADLATNAAQALTPLPTQAEATTLPAVPGEGQPVFVILPAQPFLESLSSIASDLRRLADHFAPAPGDKVGSPYVATALGQTTTWVAEMARTGTIPKGCVVEGTGNGKPWKFHRAKIDEWIRSR